MVCLRVVQRSAKTTRFTVLGATGRARGLRASGAFPPLLLDNTSRKAKSGRVTFTLTKVRRRRSLRLAARWSSALRALPSS